MPGFIPRQLIDQVRADNSEPTYRMSMLPFGTYADPNGGGEHLGLAMPGMITEPINALMRLAQNSRFEDGTLGIPNPENLDNQNDVLTGLLSMYGGNAMNPAAAIPKGALGMFAGRTAKTADHAALARAEELAAKGAPREQIWNDTGWFQGPDKNWRFEIDDSPARLSNYAWAEGGTAPTAESVRHPALFDAYPELGQGSATIYRADAPEGYADSRNFAAAGPEIGDATSAALHELQHGVQASEGFYPGARSLEEIQRIGGVNSRDIPIVPYHHDLPFWKRWRTDKETQDAAAYQSLMDSLNAIDERTWAAHHRAASEVEARNVQTRQNMTPEQRRETPPWLTQDLPDSGQLFSDTGKPSILGAAVAGAEGNTPIRAYHGMAGDLAGGMFDRSRAGTNFGNEVSKFGISFDTNPDVAAKYAQTAGVMPEYWKSLAETRRAPSEDVINALREQSPAAVYPVDISGRGATLNQGFHELGPDRMAAELQRLKEQGYDYATFPSEGGIGHREINVWNPGTVRSPLTGETLFSDTGKPSLWGSALSQDQNEKRNSLFNF